jgi:NAD(P)-dependent dehydrogenase (short-subunit alcohol dehydrogenase family)
MTLKDNVVIVTGASKGIGRATSLALAREGAHVLAVARSAALLDELAVLSSDVPGEVIAAPADVAQREQVEEVVKQALNRYGKVDILVNNAGVEWVKPIEDVTDDEYSATLDVNLKGTFLFCRAVIPTMKMQKYGLIINISSTGGLRGFGGDAVYSASKFGVIGFTEALDEELRPFGIRVSYIAPGATNTELGVDHWSPPDDPYRPYYLQPEDVARAIVFVASQPPHVAVAQMLVLPTIEPRYAPFLPIEEK